MMKNTFLVMMSVLIITGMASCDSPQSGNADTAANNGDSAQINVAPDGQQALESGVAETSDMIYYVFMNNQMQTALGKLAEEKATSTEVQAFGTEVAEQNSRVLGQIEELASASQLPLPEGMHVEYQQRMDSVSKLTGEAFDKAYLEVMTRQQQESIDLLQEMATADNPIVKGLAEDIISTERAQIERAEQLKESM